jgi:excisionase family DNA binding protein
MTELDQNRTERFLSREELARRWGISWKTVRRMEQDGRLTGVIYIGDTIVRIPASEVEQCERHAPQKPITRERNRTKDGRYFAAIERGAAR